MITHWHIASTLVADHQCRLITDARNQRVARAARRARKVRVA